MDNCLWGEQNTMGRKKFWSKRKRNKEFEQHPGYSKHPWMEATVAAVLVVTEGKEEVVVVVVVMVVVEEEEDVVMVKVVK